jgi:beta-lactam-binding protein with PASTA domain
VPNVAVPSLNNMTCAQADAALTTVKLHANCTPGAYDNNVSATLIISWSFNNVTNPTVAPYGSTITIVPSLGHQPATVPAIPTSYTFAQAQAALNAVGLTATQTTQANPTVPNGDVITTTPASGAAAPYGSAVTVIVSTGPPTVQIPQGLVGESVQQATSAIEALGLSVSGVSGNPAHNVTGTQPSVGSTVDVGSSVQIYTN